MARDYELERKIELVNFLSTNPKWMDILEEALEVQKKGEEEYKDKDYPYLGWEWYDVHAPQQTLKKMVTEKVLDITSSSRSSTYYKVKEPELVEEAIGIMKSGRQKEIIKEEKIPTDLFSPIVGYEKIKNIFKASLGANEPVHILLVGPPSTAKTLFLEELSRLPKSRYILGSATSKAGIIDYLLDYRPRYLIIDELEKADGRDLSALLSLMQTGIVARMKKGMKEKTVMRTWVFAGANEIKTLPQELKSRFLFIHLRKYSEKEFKKISLFLCKREGINNHLSHYIVDRLVPKTRDVRNVLKVGRLSKDKGQVDEVISVMFP